MRWPPEKFAKTKLPKVRIGILHQRQGTQS